MEVSEDEFNRCISTGHRLACLPTGKVLVPTKILFAVGHGGPQSTVRRCNRSTYRSYSVSMIYGQPYPVYCGSAAEVFSRRPISCNVGLRMLTDSNIID